MLTGFRDASQKKNPPFITPSGPEIHFPEVLGSAAPVWVPRLTAPFLMTWVLGGTEECSSVREGKC